MEVVAALALYGVGLDTIQTALSAVATLCSQMKDAKPVCSRVLERLTDILSELQKMEAAKRLPAQKKIDKYAQLLRKYLTFLTSYADMALVWRIMKYRSMMDELKTINEEIDALVVLLNLTTTRMLVEWKQQWEADCEMQMEVLMALVDSSASVLSEVRDTKTQVEAMTVLKFEFEQRHSEQNKDMMAILKKLYNQIVRVSKVEVPSIPQWFIPSGDVVYDVKPFAQGSFGAVHFGMWNSGARVVVKTLLVDDLMGGNRNAQTRILGEIDIWFRLHHPNVVKMFGACHVSTPPFIVCEEATHGNLADFLGKSLEHQELMWRLLYEAALGLEYLHKSRVVHGDLKLNNILVGSDGKARLADFGLSSVRSTSATATATVARRSGNNADQTSGALRWRAPECLKGKPKFASDVYSLGMCIIEAATGEPPYATVADDIVFQLLRHGEIPDQPDELNDDAWELVTVMTRQQPTERCKLGHVISTLKQLAGEAVEPVKGSIIRASSSTASTASLSSSSLDSRVSDRNSSVASDRVSDGPSSALASLSLGSRTFDDDSDLNEDTTIPGLIDALRSGKPGRVEKALRWIYRHAYYNDARPQILSWGGIGVLSAIAKNASAGYYQQLYAFGSLRFLSISTVGVTDEDLADQIRDPTSADRLRLFDSITANHPDDERTEAVEVVTCLLHAKPTARGLDDFAPLVVDLLLCRNEWLSAVAAYAVLIFDRHLPATTPVMVERGVIQRLVNLVRVGGRRQKEQAAEALGYVAAGNSANQVAVAQAGGIEPLVELVRSGIGEQKLSSTLALSQLALSCEANKDEMMKVGAVGPLVELTRTGVDNERAFAALTLAYLTQNNATNQATIAKSGAIGPLVQLIRTGSEIETTYAALALGYLANDNEAFGLAIVSLGALDAFVELARVSTNDDQKYSVLIALYTLGQSRGNKRALIQLGAKDVLSEVVRTGNDNQKNLAERTLQLLEEYANPTPSSVTREGAITGRTEAAPTSLSVEHRVFQGSIDEHTSIADLVSVLRGGQQDRSKNALKWLCRHAYYYQFQAMIPSCDVPSYDGVRVLLDIAQNADSGYDQQLYAYGCLWFLGETDLGVDETVINGLKEHIRVPTGTDLLRLFESMAPTRPVEERIEAFEVLNCLQGAKAGDHGFSDFFTRILDALRSPNERLAAVAAHAVTAFAVDLPASCAMMVERGVLPSLVLCVQNGGQRQKEAAAEALGHLAASNSTIQARVVQAGAIAPLVMLVHRGIGHQKKLSAMALAEVAMNSKIHQDLIAQSGAIRPLMDLMRGDDTSDATRGTFALMRLCETSEAAAFAVVSHGAVQPLVELLHRGNDLNKLAAAWALRTLSLKKSTLSALIRLGVGQAMREMTRSADKDLKNVAEQILRNLE